MKPRKSVARLDYSEDQLHRSVAQFLDLALMPNVVYSTFPAGWGKLSPRMAGHLKACGLKAGMPDILVFDKHSVIANTTYTKVVGLELKRPGEKPSAAQQLMFARLRDLGIKIYVCESIDDVVKALSQERIGLRITKWRDEQPVLKRKRPAEISARPADAGDGNGETLRETG